MYHAGPFGGNMTNAVESRPDVAAILKEAVGPLLAVLPHLESANFPPCDSCGLKRQINRKEHQAAVEIGAMVNKLERWAESLALGTPFKRNGG